MKTLMLMAGASMAALLSAPALAQTAPPATAAVEAEGQEVIVTGTRQTGIKAVDSAAPVQVVDSASLKRVGEPDLISSLSQNVPSLTEQALGGDAANLTLAARLRGLSPNDTLVLIDGKRRHGTANLAVLGGPYQGGAAPDLNFIPVDSIDHVEVLTDGAAAQYGTDAIAGVVNIITKHNTSGGDINVNGGTYYGNGGDTGDISANIGLAPVANSWFNATVESRFHGHSNEGNIDPRVYNHDGLVNVGPGGKYANAVNFPGYPNVNLISGDAMYHLNIAEYDAGYKFDNGFEVYSFGTYGHKNGQAFENYRTPDKAPLLYPAGYNPKEELLEDDFGFTLGTRGQLFGFNVDLSSTYGKDLDQFHTEGTANNQFAAAPPAGLGLTQTDFYDGSFIATEFTQNLDISRDFDVHMASPLTVAAGVEERHNSYELKAGEPNSYLGSGAASFPGLPAVNAGLHGRDNTGVYGDLALSPITKLKLDLAGRFEHYTDFGDAKVYKATGRYDFTPQYAVRGTISTGFRAPTLAEEFYSNVNVGPTSAFGQLAPNSGGAAALGSNGLKPESSHNYSVGLVAHPLPKVTATLDIYRILIHNRIVASGNIYGTGNPDGATGNSPAVETALVNFIGAGAIADDTMTGINLFANGLNTRTDGLEFVVSYAENYGAFGHVDWSLSGSLNETDITKVQASPASIAPQTLYDANALSIIQSASPKVRVIGAALWTYHQLTVNLRETFYGDSSERSFGDDGVLYTSKIDPTAITDLEFAYHLPHNLRVAVGANNLFNQFPDKLNPALVASYRMANDNAAVAKYPDFSPFGINGGYYYGRVTYSF